MKKIHKTLVLAMGTTLISGFTSVAVSSETEAAQNNAFEMTVLSSGYMQLAAADTKATDAKPKTMEGKCAGDKPMSAPKPSEGKCGEGKCSGTMKAAEPAKTPANTATKAATTNVKSAADTTTKATEGKCGEGKCGDAMKKATTDKTKAADTSTVKK